MKLRTLLMPFIGGLICLIAFSCFATAPLSFMGDREVTLYPGDVGQLFGRIRNNGTSRLYITKTVAAIDDPGRRIGLHPEIITDKLEAGEKWDGILLQIHPTPHLSSGRYKGTITFYGGKEEGAQEELGGIEFTAIMHASDYVLTFEPLSDYAIIISAREMWLWVAGGIIVLFAGGVLLNKRHQSQYRKR